MHLYAVEMRLEYTAGYASRMRQECTGMHKKSLRCKCLEEPVEAVALARVLRRAAILVRNFLHVPRKNARAGGERADDVSTFLNTIFLQDLVNEEGATSA